MQSTFYRALAGAAALGLLLTGCSSAADQSGTTDQNSDFDYEGPGPDSPEAQAIIETSGVIDSTEWCGTEPLTVGVADAFGINGWSQMSYAVVKSELARCDNVEVIVTAGQGDLTKAISDVNGFVAQGVDAIVIIPSLGEGQLPSLQAATDAGIVVVPWAADPGGVAGEDYLTYVDWNTYALGESWGEWVNEALDGEGTIAYLGGPAGNPVSVSTLAGLASVVEANPGLELLTGTDEFPVTNWNPSEAQSVMSSLIAQFPQIDAVVIDDGLLGEAAMRAFLAAGRDLPILATNEANLIACFYDEHADTGFELATTSNRNWTGRIAVHKAVAAAQGIEWNEPSLFNLPLQEDSINGPAPVCDPSVSGDIGFSHRISPEQFEEFGNAN